MKRILAAVLILGVVALGIGYYMYNKPVASLKNKKAAVEVSAAKLLSDYETDEAAANTIYLGKVVQVNGKVAAMVEEDGKKKIQLETGNPISVIICEMDNGNDLENIKTGDEISVKGLCTGYLSDVILSQANLIKL